MLSLGIGMNAAIKQSIMQMGSINIVTVYSGGGYMGPSGKGVSSGDTRLDINAVSSFQSIPGVEAVTPIMQNYWKIIGRKYAAEVQVVGIDPEAMQKMDYNLVDGRLLQPGDGLSMVFGSEIINMFHDRRSNGNYRMGPGMGTTGPDIDLLKEKFVITYDTSYGQRRSFYDTTDDRDPAETYDIQGVGILEPGNWENAYSIFIPIDQMEDIYEDQQKWERSGDGSNSRYERTQNEYQQVKVKVKDLNDVQTVQEAIMNMGYQAQSLNDILESKQKDHGCNPGDLGRNRCRFAAGSSNRHYQYHGHGDIRANKGNRNHEGDWSDHCGYSKDVSPGSSFNRVGGWFAGACTQLSGIVDH